MKTSSLSMRLGLTVSLMGAGLVVLLASLAYLALTHELDKLAARAWKTKWSNWPIPSARASMNTASLTARTHCWTW